MDNSGNLDGTTHYYHAGQRIVETRNGSDVVAKQHVWGLMYVDELVQIALGKGPDVSYRTWARYFYALHDVNFNVLGVVEPTGLEVYGNGCRLVERYEYTPYGERTVYSHGWLRADATRDGAVDLLDLNDIAHADHWQKNAPKDEEWDDDLNGDGTVDILDLNLFSPHYGVVDRQFTDDPMVSYPALMSFRGAGGNAQQGEPLCEFGHQGLVHDETVGLIQNRARVLHPRLGRFMQRDPLGYADGMSILEYVNSNPVSFVDPRGMQSSINTHPHATVVAVESMLTSGASWSRIVAITGLTLEQIANRALATGTVGVITSLMTGSAAEQAAAQDAVRAQAQNLLDEANALKELFAKAMRTYSRKCPCPCLAKVGRIYTRSIKLFGPDPSWPTKGMSFRSQFEAALYEKVHGMPAAKIKINTARRAAGLPLLTGKIPSHLKEARELCGGIRKQTKLLRRCMDRIPPTACKDAGAQAAINGAKALGKLVNTACKALGV